MLRMAVLSFAATDRKYLEKPCNWLDANTTTMRTLSANCEIGVGFLLLFLLIASQKNFIQLLAYWQLLKLMFHAPTTAYFHRAIWSRIGAKVARSSKNRKGSSRTRVEEKEVLQFLEEGDLSPKQLAPILEQAEQLKASPTSSSFDQSYEIKEMDKEESKARAMPTSPPSLVQDVPILQVPPEQTKTFEPRVRKQPTQVGAQVQIDSEMQEQEREEDGIKGMTQPSSQPKATLTEIIPIEVLDVENTPSDQPHEVKNYVSSRPSFHNVEERMGPSHKMQNKFKEMEYVKAPDDVLDSSISKADALGD
ncbi:hypothetical protein L7F22_063045 [Adiantum nelumboides]|nr:hypothetical protein [Adiantum nelumboides]